MEPPILSTKGKDVHCDCTVVEEWFLHGYSEYSDEDLPVADGLPCIQAALPCRLQAAALKHAFICF